MAVFTSDSYDGRYLQLSISESADAVSNTSTLYWTLSSIGGSSTYYTIDATTVTINGTQVYYKARTAWDDRVFPAAKGSVSGSISVPHNSDGTKTVSVVFSTRVYIFGSLDYGGSMVLTNIDRTAPTVSCSVSAITASGFTLMASSSAVADIWQYSINGGSSWTQFSTVAATSTGVVVSALQPSTTYSVRVRARKRSNQVYGYSGTVSVKTLGGAVVNSCDTVIADAAAVSLTMNVTVYNAAYSNYVTIKSGSATIVSFATQSWSVGTANRTITLTSDQRTALLNAMSEVKSFTATVELVTKSGTEQIGNASTCACVIQTMEANSAPTMTAFFVRDSRTTTVAVTGNRQRFIQGYDRSSWTSISLTNALAIAYGGTGSTTAAGARSNLDITCTSLFNGTLTTGSTSFNYGSYKAYIIIGQPSSNGSRVAAIVPASQITTSAVGYQIADESYYYSFNLYYSGSTCYLAFRGRSSSGQILRVFGVN